MCTCAVLFVKNPQPGKVKTRLHSHCSAAESAALYRAFVLDSAATLAAAAADWKVVAYAPAGAAAGVRDLLAEVGVFELVPQPEADLGGRMEALMRRCFARGAARAVIVGSDTPSLPVSYIDRALEWLRKDSVVLGPSTDGGYYLMGLSEVKSALFTGIDWSTGRVLEQTLERLGSASLGLLPPWYDVDTPAEAAFLKAHLEALHRSGSRQGERSLQVLRRLALPPPS